MPAKQRSLVPLYLTLLVLSVVVIFAMVAKSAGIVLNVTGSMPDTVYKLGHGEKGSLASFCSPIPHPSIGHGSCPDGSMPLIKRVVGVAGDLVMATDHGVEINGQPVPNSRPLDLDTQGQALPHVRGSFTLKQGEIWTAGEHPNSFDSRYFGAVKFPRSDYRHMTRKSSSGFFEQ
ncbi:MAG: S26 family signal peptidase [Rhodoferax sp.]|nr:S26 family signal peptidase [Rhodoferax sp.]